jgi:hypothetical protein
MDDRVRREDRKDKKVGKMHLPTPVHRFPLNSTSENISADTNSTPDKATDNDNPCAQVRGLYKGLGTNFLRVIPTTAITFVVYEAVAKHLGART